MFDHDTPKLKSARKLLDHANHMTESGDRAYFMGDDTSAGGYWSQALKHLDLALSTHPSAIVMWHEMNLARETNKLIGA